MIIGPTAGNLEKLRTEWEAWIKTNEQKIAAGKYTKDVAAALDRSVPNLSSIVMLINADNKSILLTGDCRADHLQQGLIETGLSTDGRYHVDVLKVPHHGSQRNARKKFFEEVTADTYIISADGTYNNPDEETLCWIVESARAANRKIKLILTNETPSTTALLQKYHPDTYEIQFLKKDEKYLTYNLCN
jgi:beta-lactamase superfamily II metal-dependent hydrolase